MLTAWLLWSSIPQRTWLKEKVMQPRKNNKRACLICFTGIDGSGKTTLATMLADTLEGNGIRSKYAWCGWRQFDSFLLRPFAAIIRKLLLRRETSIVEGDTTIRAVENRFLSPIYGYLVLLDYFLSTFPRVSIPLILGRTVVCDRYVYDMIAGPMSKHKMMGKVILRLLPKPDFTFFIDLPEEIAYERKTDVPSIDYLRKTKQSYVDVVQNRIDRNRLLIVDGSENLEGLKALIVGRVAEILRGSRRLSGVSGAPR